MPHRAMAQDISASYETLHSRNELFGFLRGPSIELASERAGIVALRLSYRRAAGSHLRIGSSCPNFVLPGMVCDVVYTSDLTSLSEGGVSADIRVLRGRRVDANILLRMHHSRAVIRSRLLATGSERDAGERETWAPGVGAHVSWYPQPKLPIGLRATVEAARYVGEEERITVDGGGSNPLEAGFGAIRFGAGLVWTIRGR
jgi:hypothetical protein